MKGFKHPFLDSINSLETKIDQLIKDYKVRRINNSGFVLLDNSDFMEMFKISSKTARNWREEGLIEYAQIKGKIYYNQKMFRNSWRDIKKNNCRVQLRNSYGTLCAHPTVY